MVPYKYSVHVYLDVSACTLLPFAYSLKTDLKQVLQDE